MQGLMIMLLLLSPFILSAEEGDDEAPVASFSGSVGLGGGYESDVARSQGLVGGHLGAGDIIFDLSGEVTLFDEAAVGASFLHDIMPAYDGRYTRMAIGLTADWYRDLGPVEIDLGAAGEVSLIDRFEPEPYFGSVDGYVELVIPHGEALEWLVTLSAVYQHGLRDDVIYLRGPDIFLQGAVRWHFDEEKGLLAGGYRGGVSLREDAGLYDIAGLAESGYTALAACNEHFEQALFLKASYDLAPVVFIGRFSAIHRYAFAKDAWATLYERKEKRRIELVIAPSLETRFSFSDFSDISVQYDLEYTASTIGKRDYYDMSGLRHTVRILATQRF